MSLGQYLSRLPFIALLALVPSTMACAAVADEGDADIAGDESDIRGSSFLGQVGALKKKNTSNFMAGAKMDFVLRNLGISGAQKPKEGALKCGPPTFVIELFKPNGDLLATGEFACDRKQRTNVEGTLRIAGGKSYLITATDLDDIDMAVQDESTVGELLFGANRATIGRPGVAQTVAITGAKMAKVFAALEVDSRPDFNATNTSKCPPARIVTLYKGTTKVGILAMNCSEQAQGFVPGWITPTAAPKYMSGNTFLTGATRINAAAIFALEK